MNKVTLIQYEQCNLQFLLEKKGCGIDEAAECLGDSPLRLYKVLEGVEPFGRTAQLATYALLNGLEE